MRKLTDKWFIKQKISIKREEKCKERRKNTDDPFNKSKGIVFPDILSLRDKKSRSVLVNSVNKIRKIHTSSSEEKLYIDFNKVTTLYAPATIYFSHVLEQFPKVNILSRASKSSVVRSMLTRLELNKKLGLQPCYSNHDMVNWYTFRGTDLTFGKDYDEIERILEENLSEENFLIVNDAISEAVSNVLNHAYEKHQRHLGWKVSLKVTDDFLSLVITDLGKSIPTTVPEKIDDQIINRLSNIFDFSNILGIDDAQLIDIGSQFRRSSTNQKHRGKGFGDMLEVCKKVKESILIVYSRRGVWTSDGQDYKKMTNYNNKIDGTIIFWKLPLNSPTDVEVGDGL